MTAAAALAAAGGSLPHSKESERAVLAAILLDSERHLPPTAERLCAEDFYLGRHQRLFQAMLGLQEEGVAIDLRTLQARLEQQNVLNEVGGLAYIATLEVDLPDLGRVDQYVEIVKDRSLRRRLIDASSRIYHDCQEGGVAGGEALDCAKQALSRLDRWLPKVGSTSTWEPVELAAILDGDAELQDRPTILALTNGVSLIYPCRVNAIYGEPESLKTWIALEACRQELRLGNCVLYIDFEDSPRAIVHRLRSLGAADDLIRSNFIYVQPEERVTAGLTKLEAALARSPTLAVIDGVTEAMTIEGLSLSDNADVATFYDRLPRWLARRGPAVLLIDHVVKSNDDRGRYAIGAQAKLAGITGAAYGVTMKSAFGRGRTGRAQLYLRKDRPGWVSTEGAKRLAANIEATSIDEEVEIRLVAPVPSEEFRPTFLMERISRYLEDVQHDGASGYRIREDVSGSTVGKLQALDVLVAEKFVTVEPGTRNSNIHRSVRPYRERDDLSEDRSQVEKTSDALKTDLSPVPSIGRGTEGTGQGSVFTCPEGQVADRSGQVGDDDEEELRFLS
jgi:hypothetical protein